MSSTSPMLLRDRIIERLRQDLMGPEEPNEIVADRPSQRYSTGILYPRGERLSPEEDEDAGGVVNEREDSAGAVDTSAVSLSTAIKPSVAGISFAILPDSAEAAPRITIQVTCARYRRFGVTEDGTEVEQPKNRAQERWRRIPYQARLPLEVSKRTSRVSLDEFGVEGMDLHVVVAPFAGVLTVTLAVSNRRMSGESRESDEEQHFFQVEFAVESGAHGSFAPRPGRSLSRDEDSLIGRLIYRDAAEYVVGHTCSGAVVSDEAGTVVGLRSEWVPAIRVPSVSEHGHALFAGLRTDSRSSPLRAGWLATASVVDLTEQLTRLVDVYEEWIGLQQDRCAELPTGLQAQGRKHVDRCRIGARRMKAGIAMLKALPAAREAFQLAQTAMEKQFGWANNGASLEWRPFQLAFQLLVLKSLADPTHPDRETMDLLWFPTGGGKTEAYLALAAFIIFYRRLCRESGGAGVSVLMRYTLRLLTIQQFQRASALVCACELIRRRRSDRGTSSLGAQPIGIGLWVGGAATPLKLRDAVERREGDPSTPEQLLLCPCCGTKLRWTVSLRGCRVECSGPSGEECELAQIGPLPVWTVDEEIYAHAPSLVIGTIDKFAQVTRNIDTRALFGRSNRHAPPELIIQDELHLVSGPLGTVAALYEAAVDELCRKDDGRAKIVGSTATIRRAPDQIKALFDRETYQFPSPGLDAGDSGFAVTDTAAPGRLYVGVTTAGRSATYQLQAIVASLMQAAGNEHGGKEDMDYYWTLVAYFNSLRELGRGLVLVQDDVPVSIRQIAERRRENPRALQAPAELTSRVSAYEIRDMLHRLSRRRGDPESVDLLVASNMISVGMDIPRLGVMVVSGQPKSLAEYIQATSRVGRKNIPGIVVTMYNNMRARDRSRFETFETWHRSLYRDVEATSVTPFASRAQDKALHAVLVALARHLAPGLETDPRLDDLKREAVERMATVLEERAAKIDPPEHQAVSRKLKQLIDEWAERQDLERYWDDYGRRTSLLISAEQHAATVNADPDGEYEGRRRALWPTPNSMREVEAASPFILRRALRLDEE